MLINDYRDRRRVFDTCLSNAMQKLCMGAVMLAISTATFEIYDSTVFESQSGVTTMRNA